MELSIFAFAGISYLTFKSVQMLIEIHDGLIKEVKTWDFLYFLLFFPSFSSGPIDPVSYTHLDVYKRQEKVFAIKGLEYMINSNGAHVTRLKDKKIIYSNCPDGKAVEEIELFLRQHSRYPIEVFTQGQAYIDRKVYEDVRDNGSDYLDAGYIVGTRIPVDDIYGFLHEHRSQIENILSLIHI